MVVTVYNRHPCNVKEFRPLLAPCVVTLIWIRNPFVFVDQWSAQIDGTPSQMKQRLRLPLDEALELCCQMLLDGWQKLTTQFGEDPDPQLTEEIAA